MSENNPLEKILRRALRRAGIVTGFTHVCRKKGCGPHRASLGQRNPTLPKARSQAMAEGRRATYPIP